jgi:glutaminyl-tRNA synthetase
MSEAAPLDFIRQIIKADLESGKHAEVVTRFPPEPNGYLHIGHGLAICLNFGVAEEFGGRCFLRFDDTNPVKEDPIYVEAQQRDVHWLGFDWGDRLTHASDYFGELYDFAEELVQKGLAYVDSQSADEIRDTRGTLTEPGTDSPYRERSVEENLDLLRRMKAGEFPDGAHVLRAKIDMAAPNMNMRDPVVYRIRHATHQETGDAWCIYPMYDYAHCISDALEGITHSLCSLEFEDHRPLYDWFLDNVSAPRHPRQIEFSRLGLEYTVMSKRFFAALIEEGHFDGWDDPRLPTICGLRRRGYTPTSIRDFMGRVGITKSEKVVEMSLLESCIREELDATAPRVMCVLDPVKLVIDNYPEGETEELEAPWHPQQPDMGTRTMPFTRELYIERQDFMEDPPRGYRRLSPGEEVRLRYAYIVQCDSVVKDDQGNVVEIHCTYDPTTRSGTGTNRRPKGVIHWVSATDSAPCEVRVYDRIFRVPRPKSATMREDLNPDSLLVMENARVEPALANAPLESRYQFERTGYFYLDPLSQREGHPVFNRVVSLRDTWAKIEAQERQKAAAS